MVVDFFAIGRAYTARGIRKGHANSGPMAVANLERNASCGTRREKKAPIQQDTAATCHASITSHRGVATRVIWALRTKYQIQFHTSP
jgi:hypothetical protein